MITSGELFGGARTIIPLRAVDLLAVRQMEQPSGKPYSVKQGRAGSSLPLSRLSHTLWKLKLRHMTGNYEIC